MLKNQERTNEMNETREYPVFNTAPSALGVKRDASTTICAGPSKRNCSSQRAKPRESTTVTASTGTIWSAPDSSGLKVPTELNDWASSKRQQQDQFIAINESTTYRLDSYKIAHDDVISISLDDDIISISSNDDDNIGSEGQMHLDEGTRGAASATMSTATVQDAAGDTVAIRNTCLSEDTYDSCFGVVAFENIQLQNEFFKGKAAKDVSLEINGTMVIIKDAISNKYGGLLDQSAARIVINLVKHHNVELSASIKASKRIEVLIYGWLKESDSVGDYLLEQDCFLQQPDSYDATRPYHNPQCLLHPDEEPETPWGHNELISVQDTVLDENKKSKITELLDSATGPSTFRTVQISDILITELKDHQKKALSMMIEKEAGNTRDPEFSSVWIKSSETDPSYARFYNTVTQNFFARTPRLCLGGLLADDMGLGKTLTTLALIATSLSDEKNKHSRVSRATLIVCPVTTITSWQHQIRMHFKQGSLTYRIYHGSARDDNVAALGGADIVITSYETLRSGLPDDEAEQKHVVGSRRSGILHSIDWHRVVLDEAHIVRNRTSKTFQAVYMLKTKRRWCLTGTPIQNRLDDLGTLIEFLRVDPFDNPGVFRNTFLVPINKGHPSGWDRLKSLIKAITLRRTKDALTADLNLPPRRERIHDVHLDYEEKALYDLVKQYFIRSINSDQLVMNTFQLILRLRQICNHGKDLLPQNLQAWLREASVFGDTILPQLHRCEACNISLNGEDESSYCVFSCFHQVCRACLHNKDNPDGGSDSICPLCTTDGLENAEDMDADSTIAPELGSTRYRPSSKVKALLHNLWIDRQVATVPGKPPTKSVVFSTWTGMLDLIGKALSLNGFIYERLDGSRNLAQRRSALENFRSNPDCTVLLASLGSAAVGLDLTMASHVHIMEPGWNPLLEQQAMDRVHRLGQQSEVIATRYIVSGVDSIEQYVRQRQVRKMNLIASSLDDSKAHQNEVKAISGEFMRLICVK
ncbi:SNF2 family N-terminal domain-containing protein [Hypoxylon cercidicola]|nr:SNF2 family N-terminal domain-containing protein [Hypoxylon cercidicola]